MCRLLGFVSLDEKSVIEAAGPGFEEFAQLSARHKDGWGIATCNSLAHPTLLVEPTVAKESKAFDQATHALKTTGALVHLRRATGDLAVKEGNTHPFSYGEFSFIHNGALDPINAIDGFVDPKFFVLRRGETDSESYFLLIITEIEKFGVEGGIKSALEIIRKYSRYSSVNAMFLTPSELYVICEHYDERRPSDEETGYYDLFYKKDGSEFLVASSGWDQEGWTQLPNHNLLKVDRQTLEVTITPLHS